MKPWSLFLSVLSSGACFLALVVGGLSARAEVTITGDGGNYTLEANHATRLEIAQSVAEYFDATLTGSIEDGAKISATVAGDLKRLVEAILGKDDYMLAYDQDRLTEIIVLDGSATNFLGTVSTSEAPQYSSDFVPVEQSSSDGEQAVESNDTVSDIVDRPVRVVGDDVTGQRSHELAHNQAASFGDQTSPLPSDIRSLQEQTAQNLKGLVEALNALCPPGKSC